VSFRGDNADVVLAPTASVELAQLRLKSMPTGGATPLAAGMLRAIELLEAEIRRETAVIPWLVLITDGRANVGLAGGLGSEDARAVAAKARAAKINTIVLDTGSGPLSASGARDIARSAGGDYLRLAKLDGRSMVDALRSRL
ncbi:MAG: magnesium chelatase, partial [Coriobacteriia bacterium]|nr:magnesium chelatase [Coriobacteriia bacterium]